MLLWTWGLEESNWCGVPIKKAILYDQALKPGLRALHVRKLYYWRLCGTGEYGVTPTDSTFQIISNHAAFLNRWMNSRAPHHECRAECWIPHSSILVRMCRNIPQVCDTYEQVVGGHKNHTTALHALKNAEVLVGHRLIDLHNLQVYGSKSDCCQPGLGAFPSGCSWGAWFR